MSHLQYDDNESFDGEAVQDPEPTDTNAKHVNQARQFARAGRMRGVCQLEDCLDYTTLIVRA